MILDRKALIELLPAIYRIRDREHGEPMVRLLSVIAEQIEVLQENLDQLYDDQFIETCAEWVVPYIGDLVGARGVRDVGVTGFSARAFVGNTIAYRRRKGTPAMLEQLARDVTGWNAAVVEFFLRLAWTQHLNHVRRDAPVWIDLRNAEALEQLHTPFERAMRSVDVRRIRSGRGKHNIPNIGIFLWQVEAYSLTASPAVIVDAQRWMFSPLGNDTPLFSLPRTETEIEHLAARDNVPMPITRRALARDVTRWYGDPGSILLRLGGVPVAAASIDSCDLSDVTATTWDHVPPAIDFASIDPALGRLALPADPKSVTITFGGNTFNAVRVNANRYTCNAPGNAPFIVRVGGVAVDPNRIELTDQTLTKTDVLRVDATLGVLLFPADPEQPRVTFHYGMPGDVGGGEYERESSFLSPGTKRVRVPDDKPTIKAAIADLGTKDGIVEITESGRYTETAAFAINLAAGQQVELRAKNGARPTLILDAPLQISGQKDSELSINGLLIAKSGLVAPASQLRALRIRHCTLVPGLELKRDGSALLPDAPSITVSSKASLLSLEIDHSITGRIGAESTAGTIAIRDSILQSTNVAGTIGPNTAIDFGPATTIERSTIFGLVKVKELTLASESIFTDVVTVERKQSGCARFTFFVLPASKTPRRYRCQPEQAAQDAIEVRARELAPNAVPAAEVTAIRTRMFSVVRPEFVSRRYGDPAYAQLSPAIHRAIRTGAEDGSEIGVYRSVESARREANLTAALDEYLRFGLEAGIFYAS
ncbi:MAG TPA: hypothetical protein VNA69_09780 [Thermoanaerobaculia bacterium]|nr:hypothetical protein [Thermoanaerobaculia bacterium]